MKANKMQQQDNTQAWEYSAAVRQQRKQSKLFRQQRSSKRNTWEVKGE